MLGDYFTSENTTVSCVQNVMIMLQSLEGSTALEYLVQGNSKSSGHSTVKETQVRVLNL